MSKVLMDGPGAGMTEQEYEAARAVDCKIAEILGWVKVNVIGELNWEDGTYWSEPPPWGHVWQYRDEGSGVPFYSFDMNGAHKVLLVVASKWNYVSRCHFFGVLQRRASLDPVDLTLPQYPDVFLSLADDLHTHICHAFIDAHENDINRGHDPFKQSPRAAEFVDAEIERREHKETLANGAEVPRYNPKPNSTPWVKEVVSS